jgi:hypothetical protein
MVEVTNPGGLADAIELELERFRHAGVIVRMPEGMTDLAGALERVAGMLREAEALGQAVDVGDEVLRFFEQFRSVLTTVGGAPALA